MGALVRQLRYAMRALRRARGFTLAVVMALALGTGFGIPVLSLVRAAALRPVPYTDPLLREDVGATAWLPGGTDLRQTVSQIQDGALQALFGVLLALTVLLLTVALVNVLALGLSRAAVRRPEVALRAVLGAPRRHLVAPLAAEGALLLLVGSGLGLAVGAGVAVLLHGSWPGDAPPWVGSGVDGAVAAAVASVFAVVSLLAWLSPVGVAWRRDLRQFLAAGGRSTSDLREVFARQALAVVQMAASLVLLTGAGLLLRAFALPAAGGPELGFDPRDTLTLQLRFPAPEGAGPGDRRPLYRELHGRVAAIPGVVDVGVATPGAWLGIGTADRVTTVCTECWLGSVIKPVSDGLARVHAVGPGFFRALGTPVLRGRELGRGDGEEAPRVAVINDTFAYRLFPHGEPLGKSIQVGGRRGAWYTVVGIVDDVRAPGIGSGAEPVPAVYLSTLQHRPSTVSVAVRAAGDPMELLPAVEAAVRALAPGAMLADAGTLQASLARFRAPLRWFALLFGGLAGVALLLAVSGLRGVLAYNARRRTREIGVRMALGARPRDVVRLVLGEGLRITGTGTVLGLFGALPLARVLQLRVEGVEPFDPLLFAGIAGLLGGVALLAGSRAARRAAGVDPQLALRAE